MTRQNINILRQGIRYACFFVAHICTGVEKVVDVVSVASIGLEHIQERDGPEVGTSQTGGQQQK